MRGRVSGNVGLPHDLPPVIDRTRNVVRGAPRLPRSIAEPLCQSNACLAVNASSRFPAAGGPYNIAAIADRVRKGDGVAGVRRQRDRRAVRLPDHPVVIEALGFLAAVALGAGFGPTDDLAAFVHAGGKAVVSAQRWKRRHPAVLPAKPLAKMRCVEKRILQKSSRYGSVWET